MNVRGVATRLPGPGRALASLRVDQFLYYLAFGLYVLDTFLDRTTFEYVLFVPLDDFRQLLQVSVLALLLIKTVLFQRASVRQWFVAVALVALGFVTWRISAVGWLFWTALFIVCGQGMEVRHLAMVSLIVTVPMLLITVAFAYSGVIENTVLERDSTGAARYAMGFTHPNHFGLTLFKICISFSVLRFGRRPGVEFLLIGLSALLCLLVSNSRTPLLALGVLAVMLVMFYMTHDSRLRRYETLGMLAAVAALAAFSLYGMVEYSSSNTLLAQVNSLLSGRFKLAHMYYTNYSLTLLGREYTSAATAVTSGGRYFTFLVDNVYCHLLLRYGLVAFAVLMFGVLIFYADAMGSGRWDACLLGLTVLLIYGFSESSGLKFADNYFLIGLADILYREVRQTAGVLVRRPTIVEPTKDSA